MLDQAQAANWRLLDNPERRVAYDATSHAVEL
jgi:hypothetical protein